MTSLLDIWIGQKTFFEAKSVEQIIGIAGDGSLRDGNEASAQFRELLANLPSQYIARYVNECLERPFQQGGLVLQDLVNEIGRRLGFVIESGFYRGGGSKIGFDGIWRAKDNYGFVIEVKTTDAYQMNLDTQAQYRRRLISAGKIEEKDSSILLVVGRRDTGGLEAQTRGSRHAWDVRIIGVDALLKLMRIKENLTDARTVSQIQEVLKPHEYTRIDRLIDVIFTASEDLQTSDSATEEPETDETETPLPTQASPVSYHDDCVARISAHLGVPLIKQGRSTYASADQATRVLCIVSKEYHRAGAIRYWYAFHPAQKDFLDEGSRSLVAFGCGSPEDIVLLPSELFQKHLSEMRKTESDGRFYWHVEIFKKGNKFLLNKPTIDGVDVTEFVLT